MREWRAHSLQERTHSAPKPRPQVRRNISIMVLGLVCLDALVSMSRQLKGQRWGGGVSATLRGAQIKPATGASPIFAMLTSTLASAVTHHVTHLACLNRLLSTSLHCMYPQPSTLPYLVLATPPLLWTRRLVSRITILALGFGTHSPSPLVWSWSGLVWCPLQRCVILIESLSSRMPASTWLR